MVSMASELSKTAISRMRVAELKQELANRGLESDGIRPVLQARLGQAAEVERARNVMDQGHQHPSAYARTPSAEADSTAGTPPRLSRGPSLSKQTGQSPQSQRARSISTSVPEPPRSSSEHKYVMQFDGGSRGNPGPSGAGAVLYRLGGSGARVEVWSGSVWVGQRRTNNEAEYTGLIEGLRAAKELGIKRLAVEGDSKLVIQQMLGNYKVSSPKMAPLFKKAKSIAKSFDKLEMEHIERASNDRADTLANLAMDTEKSSTFTHPSFVHSAER
eukprot:g16389.t1